MLSTWNHECCGYIVFCVSMVAPRTVLDVSMLTTCYYSYYVVLRSYCVVLVLLVLHLHIHMHIHIHSDLPWRLQIHTRKVHAQTYMYTYFQHHLHHHHPHHRGGRLYRPITILLLLQLLPPPPPTPQVGVGVLHRHRPITILLLLQQQPLPPTTTIHHHPHHRGGGRVPWRGGKGGGLGILGHIYIYIYHYIIILLWKYHEVPWCEALADAGILPTV